MLNSATMKVLRACLGLALLMSGLAFSPGTFSNATAGEQNMKGLLSGPIIGNPEITRKLELAEFNRQFLLRVEAKLDQFSRHELFTQKMLDYPAGEKMAAFFLALQNAEAEGFDAASVMTSLSNNDVSLFKGAVSGDLSGNVTVEGSVDPSAGIEVAAFDVYGFFVRSADVDPSTGDYTMTDLHPGAYYVITHSDFVDEFFDNVIFDFAQNWRLASLVNVPDNGSATGIDFDLQRGATISGTIFQADGTTPLANTSVTFQVIQAADPERSLTIMDATDASGGYEINVPTTGAVKMSAEVPGFEREFYNNKPGFFTADVITISTLDDVVPGIDFSLEAIDGPEDVDRGAIHGSVLGPASAPVPLAFVFAFDVADTSVAGFTLSGFTGAYELPIDDGKYILYANQVLDFLPLGPAVQGEYYDNASTPDEATSVTVANMDTVTGIDFSLDIGGTISGNITDSAGTPLDSVLVLAFRFDQESMDDFFVDDLDIGLAFSSADGNYSIPGLSGGNYVLRTVSSTSPTAADLVIDEYYMGVQSLFDYDQATPVTVASPATTENIDFVLEIGSFISGGFFELDGSTPVVGEVSVIVFDETGRPVLVQSQPGPQTNTYEVGPLAVGGSYRLLGLVFPPEQDDNPAPASSLLGLDLARNMDLAALQQDDVVIYLPQFYDGKPSLAAADNVVVASLNPIQDINFKMLRAATLQGFVFQPNGDAAGADFLAETSILVYHAVSGELVTGAEVTFSGGYRILGLPPGPYKVEALTATQGFAATYHGGGATFDDVNSAVVTLTPGETQDADITLASADGIISGTVFNDDGSSPVSGVLVLAYDQTGHVLSVGLSGFDLDTMVPASPGEYQIPGLRNGDYFVRTFSLFRLTLLLQSLGDGGDDSGGDPLALILGLLASGPEFLSMAQDFELNGDVWYTNVLIEINLDNENLFLTILGLLLGDRGFESLIPFFDPVPAGAAAVAVNGTADNIDFFLPPLSDVLTSVESDLSSALPETFQLEQNYPNPFNPSTIINYSIAQVSDVRLRIFNVLGQRVRTLFDGRKERGTFTVQWDGLNDQGGQVAGGIYFLRLETDQMVLSRKMLLVK